MQLLTKFIDERNWRKSNLKTEESYIKTFWSLDEALKILEAGKVLACSIKIYKLTNEK